MVKEIAAFIEDRGSYDQAFRMQKVMAQALDYSVLKGNCRANIGNAIIAKLDKFL